MEKKAVFSEMLQDEGTGGGMTPEFLFFYRKGILLALKEQGAITDEMFRFCMEDLERRDSGGKTAAVKTTAVTTTAVKAAEGRVL